MQEDTRSEVVPGPMISRRAWLAGALLAWAGTSGRADEPGRAIDDDEREIGEVEAIGKEAGLKPFRMSRSGNYLAIGDAGDRFRSLTLRDCETLAADSLDYYRAQQFNVTRPGRRLTVVTLADDRSFAAFF